MTMTTLLALATAALLLFAPVTLVLLGWRKRLASDTHRPEATSGQTVARAIRRYVADGEKTYRTALRARTFTDLAYDESGRDALRALLPLADRYDALEGGDVRFCGRWLERNEKTVTHLPEEIERVDAMLRTMLDQWERDHERGGMTHADT